MRLLEERILKDGKILDGNILKVDSFLNHQLDTVLLTEIGREFARLFKDCDVNKILTIEASGIAVGFAASQFFNYCPLLFAKKGNPKNVGDDVYHAIEHSYTRDMDIMITVSKAYLNPEDRVLILDDFLANGEALNALSSIVLQSGATLVGCGIVIEKANQRGGERIRNMGIRVESLVRIASMSEEGIEFCQ